MFELRWDADIAITFKTYDDIADYVYDITHNRIESSQIRKICRLAAEHDVIGVSLWNGIDLQCDTYSVFYVGRK